LLAVEQLTKRYGLRAAIDGLALSLRPGEVFGLVGANGGGKTTTLRVLAGILKPDRVRGQILGFDLLRERAEIRAAVGYMSQRFSLYADLTVCENLRFRAEVYDVARPRAAAHRSIAAFGLGEYTNTAAGKLSGGFSRRLQLAAALVHSPRLILLDEPTAGLDAVSRHEVWGRMQRLAAERAGVIVSTHDLAEAERCSRVAFLREGRVLATGSPEEIAKTVPGRAFLLSGSDARALAQSLGGIPGVAASYALGSNLRVIAQAEAGPHLARLVRSNGAELSSEPMRLEDAALLLSSPSSRSTE
jgi:ABC-type multidrug transport system ATPase subunit